MWFRCTWMFSDLHQHCRGLQLFLHWWVLFEWWWGNMQRWREVVCVCVCACVRVSVCVCVCVWMCIRMCVWSSRNALFCMQFILFIWLCLLFPPTLSCTNCSQDVNECRTGTAGCQHNCRNSQGSYSCSCRQGYTTSVEDHRNCTGEKPPGVYLFQQNECLSFIGRVAPLLTLI